MKVIKAITLIILPMILFIGCSYGSAPASVNPELKVKVDFHCPGGKARIEDGLKKVDGVISVVADLETKIVTVVYDGDKLNKDKIVEAIEKIGHRTEFSKPETTVKSACSHPQGEKEEPKK